MAHRLNTCADDAAVDRLYLGAEDLAENFFQGRLTPRQVYRLSLEESGWPIFRIRGKLAALDSSLRAEVRRREQEAATKLARNHEAGVYASESA